MTTSGKLIPTLLSVLILTACGGEDTASSSQASSSQDGGDDPVPVNTNTAPVISGTPASSVDEGSSYSFTPVASDADGDALSFTVENLPYWASFNTSSGRISGTPDENAAGTYSNLLVRVSDGELSAALPSFDIVVNNVDQGSGDPVLPELAPTLLSAVVSGSNVVLTWSQDGLTPDGGYDIFIDGVDTRSQYRTTSLTATVSGLDLSVSHCFNVESRYLVTWTAYVSNQLCTDAQAVDNRAPSISGSPAATVQAGVAYSFTPSASDPDEDSLSFSANNVPSWASFDSQTGTISGTPQESDVGVYADVSLSVSDGELTASISPFSITVEAVENQAPVISGSPAAAVDAGVAYSFTPSASDPDEDSLSFTVTNLPSWASFDSQTGTISGTPQESDVGVYADVRLSVTDGELTASISPFSITVETALVQTGSLSLRWAAPSTRTDGSSLEVHEIDGYCIYLGDSSSNLTMEVDLNDGLADSYTFTDLPVGTYFVAVTAYDTDGNHSGYSNTIEMSVSN